MNKNSFVKRVNVCVSRGAVPKNTALLIDFLPPKDYNVVGKIDTLRKNQSRKRTRYPWIGAGIPRAVSVIFNRQIHIFFFFDTCQPCR
jgi:hypothetical protein